MVSADAALCSRRSARPAVAQRAAQPVAPDRFIRLCVRCDEERNNMVRMYRSGGMTSMATQFKLWLYHNSVCVSSADPRLREFDKQISNDR